MKRTIVIVGGVAGGASCAARARRLDETAAIIMLERGEHISFANCGLPYFVSGEIARREKLLVTAPERMRNRFGIDVRVRHEVLSIDRAGKTVEVRDHQNRRTYHQAYDVLVLSPGARPVRPPLPGLDNGRVFCLRTVPDAERIRQFVEENDPRSAAVVGGGAIGLEMAENLAHLGLRVTLVEMADQVMPWLDPEMAEWIHQHLRFQGVEVLLSSPLRRCEAGPNGQVIVRAGGQHERRCDLVICAVGVKPESDLARAAGLEIGAHGGVLTNEQLQTSDPDIYAIGDVIELKDRTAGARRLMPLAGLANRQGRLAADHICGKDVRYPGAVGTGIVRVFDLTVASTGANEKTLKAEGLAYEKSYTHPASHAGYYPGAVPMVMKLLFAPDGGRLLGAQVVGIDGVDKRIDVLATALYAGLRVADLAAIELSYAPQFGTGKDAVNLAGYVGGNILDGDVEVLHTEQLDRRRREGGLLVDVRTAAEFHRGHIAGAVNVPIDELRRRLGEIPRHRTLLVYCLTGIRSYYACRILRQDGFCALNLSGGYMVYCASRPAACKGIPGLRRWKRTLAMETFCSTPEERQIVENQAPGRPA
jgi:NADPH-dependent 2,4-dienoyl-CoA reductase/sulfur reductase-like enzyme/rhodanese-related sulfurtransferase